MTEQKAIKILGTEYQVLFRKAEDDKKLDLCGGYFDHTAKQIIVGSLEPEDMSVSDLEVEQKRVLRHEIVHAFLYESGLWCNTEKTDHWATSEEMTDWISIQFSKMLQAFQEAGAL